MSEITVSELAAKVEELEKDVEIYSHIAKRLERHVEDFRASASSRTGLPGARGETGPAGRDAAIRIVQAANNKVHVIDELSGRVAAKILTVPGKNGADGHTPTEAELVTFTKKVVRDGRDGRDGHSPTEEELVALITKVIRKLVS